MRYIVSLQHRRQHNSTRDYEVKAMGRALLSCVGDGRSLLENAHCKYYPHDNTFEVYINSNDPKLIKLRPPSYGCDLYLGLKRSCRAPAHQGQADDMSNCHSPFCLVTPHDDVILKPEKNSPLLWCKQIHANIDSSIPFYILGLVQLASFSRSYTRSIQASTRSTRALNNISVHIFCACLVLIEYGVLGSNITQFQAFYMWEDFNVNA
jgi:hypothetical protein